MARMYSVSPASTGGGTYLSDYELMQTAISNHDLKTMLKSTVARPSLGSTHGAIGGGLGLLIKSGRPGQVPSVLQQALKSNKMLDVLKAVMDEFGVEMTPIASTTGGSLPWQSPSYTMDRNCNRTPQVARNQPLGPCNFALAANHSSDYAWPPTAANPMYASLGALTAVGAVNPGFRAWGAHYVRISTTFKTWTLSNRKATLQQLNQFDQIAAPGPSKMTTPGRKRSPAFGLRSHLKGYQLPATDIVVGPGRGGGGEIISRTPTIHRQVPTKTEKKTYPKVGALIGAYHKLTEINDLFDSLADAIPGKPCSALPGFLKMTCVVEHWDEINPLIAAKNIAMNEIEDKLVAKFQGQLGKLTEAGGPSTTQMNQFLRQLQVLLK